MNENKRKAIGTVLGIVLFVCCILLATYAWYVWRSEYTNVSANIEENVSDVVFSPSTMEVNASDMGPILDYTNSEYYTEANKGKYLIYGDFSAKNKDNKGFYIDVNLNIASISDNLKVDSFKYVLLKKNTTNGVYNQVVSEGDFSSLVVGDNNIISFVLNSGKIQYYRFVIYIDGNIYNSNDIMNGSLRSFLKLSYREINMSLSDVEPGSYVAYTGNNGCSGESCNGQNANYVSDTDMGYCSRSIYKFIVNGWRVGYISDGTAYLVSAGAPTCLCTNADGTVDTSGSSCSDYETTNGAPQHTANLNNEALKYCNSNYAYGGVCNSSSAWSIKDDDFNQITGSTLSACFGNSNDDCGLDNTLIDNGGLYWYATPKDSASSNRVFIWHPDFHYVGYADSDASLGLRPVLRLQSTVYTIGGFGTYEDPYVISNSNVSFDVNNGISWNSDSCGSSFILDGNKCIKRVSSGDTYGELPTPTRAGYTFGGWYTTSTGGTKVTDSTVVSASNYHTIYAHWNPEIYTISYDANGGSGAPSSQTKEYGVNLTLSSNIPTRDGYIFLGWSTSANATSATYKAGGTYSVNANTTLYAVWQEADVNVVNISIDGSSSDSLPTSGTYTLSSYSCSKGSTLAWDTYSKSLTYGKGAKVGDICSVNFTSSTNYPLLNTMEVGSYVAYTGSGGTVGSTSVACKTNGSASSSTADAETEAPNSCKGQNAREDLDSSGYTYGYCYSTSYKYYATGWRIAYIDSNNKPVIVSAGSPECNSRTSSTANVTYIKTANAKALKYCNTDYVDGNCTCTDSDSDGLCDSASTDAWAINDTDFYNMTKVISGYGKRLTGSSSSLGDSGGTLGSTLYCYGNYSYKECGYNNSLIDNGGYYWFAAQNSSSSANGVFWYPGDRRVGSNSRTDAYGLRPVINLSSTVYVTGGSGTIDDPYTIGN